MKPLNNLKNFNFNYAQYDIEDLKGNKGQLKIDYLNEKIEILVEKKPITKKASEEIIEFAEDLIKRKSGKNFVGKDE